MPSSGSRALRPTSRMVQQPPGTDGTIRRQWQGCHPIHVHGQQIARQLDTHRQHRQFANVVSLVLPFHKVNKYF